MELKEFIKEAVMEVLAGVELAQEASYKKYNKVHVAPSWEQSGSETISTQMLELATTVTALEGTEKNAGLNLVNVVKGGVKRDDSTSTASRIKINLPITYPVYQEEKD